MVRSVEYYDLSQRAKLSPELVDLERIRLVLKPSDVVYVDESLGAYSFLASRWVAYFLRDVPLVYAPVHHAGGYIYGLDRDYPERYSKVTYVLRAANASNANVLDAVFRNKSYELVPLQAVEFRYGSGFYGDEGGWRWMGQAGELNLLGSCVRKVKIQVLGRFQGATGESAILLRSDGGKALRFDLPQGSGEIDYPVSDGSGRSIYIESLAKAQSPKGLGLSVDSRMLTFYFGSVVVEKREDCK